jgi:hypothetical protein
MTIDFVRRHVITPAWQAEFIDCSTAEVQCLEVPDRFILAFPRSCAAAEGGWSAAGTRFRGTAPMPHYAPPSGGYISDRYPRIHLAYLRGSGFVRWSRTARTPYDRGWNDGADRLEEYSIRYVGAPAAFACR